MVSAGLAATVETVADIFGFVRKLGGDTVIKDIERTIPQTVVAELLAILGNATFELVNLLETTLFHHGAQHFATNAAGAIGDNRLIFQSIVFRLFSLLNKVAGVVNRWHDRVLELANGGLVLVASIKEPDVFVFDKLV